MRGGSSAVSAANSSREGFGLPERLPLGHVSASPSDHEPHSITGICSSERPSRARGRGRRSRGDPSGNEGACEDRGPNRHYERPRGQTKVIREEDSGPSARDPGETAERSEEHTSELQSLAYLVCRLLLEKKKKKHKHNAN